MKVMQFIALVLTAVALVPAGSHLFALPNKMHMTQNDYLVAQSVYNGWALFGIVLFGNVVVLAALALLQRGQTAPFMLVLISLGCQLATLAIFFAFVFPANQATANWTELPANWQQLRQHWEYGHAASALIALAGFCALVISVLLTRDGPA
jgi:hypothetical protein